MTTKKSKWDVPMSRRQKRICIAAVVWWIVFFGLSLKFGFVFFVLAYAGVFVGLATLMNVLNQSKPLNNMTVELTKKDLIKLVEANRPGDPSICDMWQKKGAMDFTGNQWNIDWRWRRSYLEQLTESQLFTLFQQYRNDKP